MRSAPLFACLLGLALLGACDEDSGDPKSELPDGRRGWPARQSRR